MWGNLVSKLPPLLRTNPRGGWRGGQQRWGDGRDEEGFYVPTESERTAAKHQGLVWLDVGTSRSVEPTTMQDGVSRFTFCTCGSYTLDLLVLQTAKMLFPSLTLVLFASSGSPDVWQCLADLCNMLALVDHGEVPLYKVDTDESEGDEELTVLLLEEDRLLAGFVPLLAAPQEPCYIDRHTDMVSGE